MTEVHDPEYDSVSGGVFDDGDHTNFADDGYEPEVAEDQNYTDFDEPYSEDFEDIDDIVGHADYIAEHP